MHGRRPRVSAKNKLLRVRFVLYAVVLGLVGYSTWRFELTSLPSAGCSPLDSIAPGASLWVDTRPSQLHIGDDVLFREEGRERLALGRIRKPPEALSDETQAMLDRGALWISGDDNGCGARDSRLLGPIEPQRVQGRILFTY